MFSKEIKDCVYDLNVVYSASALKASFEDEGINDEDLTDLVLLSGFGDLEVAVKIGGAEANSDIVRCLRRGVVDIVAPLVESSYAVRKFVNAAKTKSRALGVYDVGLHVNLETKTAVANAKDIITDHKDSLRGVVVGRSDLSMSMGLQKANVDDEDVMDCVRSVLCTSKKNGLMTTMGGTISVKSVPHIISLKRQGLLDRFETRAVVFNINTVDEHVLSNAITKALEYEQLLLDQRAVYHKARASELDSRVKSVEGRKND